jgi:hypothetical protein
MMAPATECARIRPKFPEEEHFGCTIADGNGQAYEWSFTRCRTGGRPAVFRCAKCRRSLSQDLAIPKSARTTWGWLSYRRMVAA